MPKIPATRSFRITIESILGGHSLLSHFADADQFRSSIGIDPASPLNDDPDLNAFKTNASGYLRPSSFKHVSGAGIELNNAPLWIKAQPKTSSFYVLDSAGSAYVTTYTASPVTALSDGGSLSGGSGNGMEYYDNYIYMAKNTTIARYGPLDGTPVFDGDYWAGTLGKTALTNPSFPQFVSGITGLNHANHVMHRHSDGKLYIADVQGGQGVLHMISTTKTTVEGDTDAGSTYQKLVFGYGLYPTAIESYGSNLVITLWEGNTTQSNMHAKVAFWDTNSQNFNQITWNEYPDRFISSVKNVNGTLYFTSSGVPTSLARGFRVMQYVGGNSFAEVRMIENGFMPMGGAVDGDSRRLLFGTLTYDVSAAPGCIYSINLRKAGIAKSGALFNIARLPGTTTSLLITASGLSQVTGIMAGWTTGSAGSGGTNNSISHTNGLVTDVSATTNQVWWSQTYRLGQPFKITKVRFPMASTVGGQQIVTPKIYTDENAGITYTLKAISNTNFPGKRAAVFRSDQNGGPITGDHNFWLELLWSGADLATVALPIIIEGEYTEDN